MEFIPGKKNEDVYAISFWVTLGWMFFGPVVFVIAYGTMYAFKYGDVLDQTDYLNGIIITELIAKILPLVLAGLIFRKMFKQDFLNLKKNWLRYLVIFVGGCLILYFANEFLEWLYETLKVSQGTPSNQAYIEQILASRFNPVMFVIAVVVAPIFEELIFRKFLIGYLKNKTKLPNYAIYLISATLFAGIHVLNGIDDLIFFPMYFALSFVITLSYNRSHDNIYVASGIHFINNLLSFLGL